MNPVAFNIFGIDIRWYGVLISFGMILGLVLAQYTCRLKNISYDELTNIFFISFPVAIIGARTYYVIFEFQHYKDNLIDIFNIRQGGLAIHGGVIFGFVAAFIYTKVRKQVFLKFADAVAPSLILAQAIGRWGNFFNGEAHGGPVTYEFIKIFPKFIQKGMLINGSYYHPTFLYESIWNICVCLMLIFLLKRKVKDGVVIFSYIGFYSIGRFFIEGLRTDSLMFLNIRMAQFISIIGVILWISYLIYIYKNKKI